MLFSSNSWAVDSQQIEFPVGFGAISPSLELRAAYDDNIFSEDEGPGVKKSWLGILAPAVEWRVRKGLNQYSARYRFESGSYFSSHDDDYLDHLFEANAHFDFNSRNRLDFDFRYAKDHQRRGTGVNDNSDSVFIEKPVEYRDWELEGQYSFGANSAKGRIVLNASHLDREYTNYTDLYEQYDRTEDLLGLTFFYRFRPNSSLYLRGNYNRVKYKNDPGDRDKLDNNETSAFVGITWATTEKTTGVAQIGYEKKKFRSSQYKSHAFVPWNVGIEWSPKSYSTFTLNTERRADESQGTGNFTQSTESLLSWEHDWSYRYTTLMAFELLNRDFNESERKDDIVSLELGLDYLLTRTIVLGTRYQYEKRDSSEENRDYLRNVFTVSLEVGL